MRGRGCRDGRSWKAAEAERWKAWPLQLSSRSDFSGVAQYFVEYVRQQLEATYGANAVYKGYKSFFYHQLSADFTVYQRRFKNGFIVIDLEILQLPQIDIL